MVHLAPDRRRVCQGEAVTIAREVLDRKRGIAEATRALASLAHGLVDDWRVDPDFVVIGALDSDLDRFPLSTARPSWEPTALATADKERAEIERVAEPKVRAACRSIVDRFGRGPTSR
jgi:hypothetical protein